MDLEYINSLTQEQAQEAFYKCSGSTVWTDAMLNERPFVNAEDIKSQAEECWHNLTHEDWLNAFGHHPKIGDLDALRTKFASTAGWASNEQSSVSEASEETIKRLAQGNKEYEEKFGYIFIVCASGKSASEMLSILEDRLKNPPEVEFEMACNEQKKITQLRLEKLKK